ncbi:MAG TPA: MerR family transcriptional regulator [Candidatus Tectomicrobia bacterium]|nr:MerR family transcriptional regulator [Candidatus Tectomicrobia bacterium]
MHHDQKYPIRVVARRTGLTSHVIRVWEKRYGAVSPMRTPTNRRLYSDADVVRLQLLRRATLTGHSIGQIARLPIEGLRTLVAADDMIAPSLPRVVSARWADSSPPAIVAACLQAVEELEAPTLEEILTRASVVFSQPVLIEQVIVPLMYRIGDLWHEGTLRVANEHLASAVVRTSLGNLSRGYGPSPSVPGLVVATPTGQMHELGALIVATTATSDGWRVTYLGPSLPAEEIAGAAHQSHARAVALSLVYPGDDPFLRGELVKLRRGLADGVVLLVGGRAADTYRNVLEETGAVWLEHLSDFRKQLKVLRLRKLHAPQALLDSGAD